MGSTAELVCAHPTEFMVAVERMQQEHTVLREQLNELCRSAKSISEYDEIIARTSLSRLRERALAFIEKAEAHLSWAIKDLFPMLGLYAGNPGELSIRRSIWGLDKDQELAKRYTGSFVNAVDSAREEEANEAVSHLLQACVVWSDYLNKEQEMVFPLAEEMLTDIDYLFS